MSNTPLMSPASKESLLLSPPMSPTVSGATAERSRLPLRMPTGSFRSATRAPLLLILGGAATLLVTILALSNGTLSAESALINRVGYGQQSRACYPYHEPGTMRVDDSGKYLHSYTSLSGACPAKNDLLPLLVNGFPPAKFHDKTILLLGDSVDMGLLAFFMNLPGAKLDMMPINPNLVDPKPDTPRTNRVYFEKFNLTIGHYFFHGLDENNDWNNSSMIAGAGRWRERFEAMSDLWSGSKPDLIITQSGLWDLARYQLKFITPSDHDETSYAGLQGRFLSDWQASARDFIHQVQTLFPHTPIFWRLLHQAVKQHSWQGAKANGVHPLRVEQLRQLQLSVVGPMQIPTIPLDLAINHQADVMGDAFHPSELGYSVYAELVLAALDAVLRE